MKITLDESIFIKNTESLQEAESPWDKLEKTYGDQLDVTNDKSKKDQKVVDPDSTWGKIARAYGDQLDLDESTSNTPWDKLEKTYGDQLKPDNVKPGVDSTSNDPNNPWNKIDRAYGKQLKSTSNTPWDNIEKNYGDQLKSVNVKPKVDSTLDDPNSPWTKISKAYGKQLDLDESKSMNPWDKLVAFYGDALKENKLEEDTIKQDGKWVNKGKEGTHGTFRTKKEADAQRKAMFAQGYKEGLNEMLDKYHFYDVQEFEAGTPERSRLELVASILTKESGKGRKYEVKDTWMDYGSQLAWTTIIYTDPDDNYGVQILSPKEWADLLNAENDDEINQVIDQITSGEYWSDTKVEQPDQEVDVDEKLDEDFDFNGDIDGDEDITFYDSGREFKVLETHDTKDVDGYELSVVHVEDVDDGTDWFYVLLDGDVEWGPEDTYEGAKSWYDTVNDGYYVDDEPAWDNHDDDVDFDDNYSEEDLKTLFGDDVKVESLDNKKSVFQDVVENVQFVDALDKEQKELNPAVNEIKSDPSFNDYDDEW